VAIVGVDSNRSEQDVRVALPMPFDEFFARHHDEMVRALTLALGDVESVATPQPRDLPGRGNAGRPCPVTPTPAAGCIGSV